MTGITSLTATPIYVSQPKSQYPLRLHNHNKLVFHKAKTSKGDPLTKREKEILGLFLAGQFNSYEGASSYLNITQSTFTKHMTNMFKKSGTNRREALLAWYRNQNHQNNNDPVLLHIKDILSTDLSPLLEDLVQSLVQNFKRINPSDLPKHFTELTKAKLTPREKETLAILIRTGSSNEQIAAEMGISPHTIEKDYIVALKDKLLLEDRLDLLLHGYLYFIGDKQRKIIQGIKQHNILPIETLRSSLGLSLKQLALELIEIHKTINCPLG